MWEKLKSLAFDERIFTVALICATAAVSFSLGRVSGLESQPTGPRIVIEQPNEASLAIPSTTVSAENAVASVIEAVEPSPAAGGEYVASRSGARYHHITCPGAKQIKEQNKIFFASAAAAQAAGYTKAANCSR